MKRFVKIAGDFFSLLFKPIYLNGGFFFFMYVLGVACGWIEAPAGYEKKMYPNTYIELFVDLYIICFLLALLPQRIRRWVRAVLYVLFYGMAFIDVFCYVKFGSLFSPSMLLLVGETTGREAGEFLGEYISLDLLSTPLVWVLVILLLHLIKSFSYKRLRSFFCRFRLNFRLSACCGVLVLGLLVYGGIVTAHNKAATWRLLSFERIGDVEHELTQSRTCARLYTPVHRLVFSLRSNQLIARQVVKLVEAKEQVTVDSCSFRTPNIVLIIGESYNRHHAGLYGYEKETTPLQSERARMDGLIPFSDVVAPWNLTSYVFKLMFSLYAVGDEGEWCDYPMFPTVFRKAGYRVTFLTNQFLPKAKEAIYDFSGGFFLNNPELSKSMFDLRNDSLHTYDEGLLSDYEQMRNSGKLAENNLIIFHLMGQHMAYKARYPRNRRVFKDYHYEHRTDLKHKDVRILSHYDNATLYNDSVVDQIIRRFEGEQAVIIYVPDHGEECYDGKLNKMGRLHQATIDARLAREEFEIPFWVWCSQRFRVAHPDVYERLQSVRNLPLMTDGLPHLLLGLAGIKTPAYQERLDILSPAYDTKRPRIMKMQKDYNQLQAKRNAKNDKTVR